MQEYDIARLHHIGLGIRLARKGWLRKEDVFNTRPVTEVEKFLKTAKAKRYGITIL